MLTVKVSFDMTDAIIKRKGIENFGPVHNRINNIILSYCEPYIPKRSGALIASGKSGVGSVSWSVPYAKKQYYENKGRGLRGRLWFDRMWASRKGEIMAEVNRSEGIYSKNKAYANMTNGPRRLDSLGGKRWL